MCCARNNNNGDRDWIWNWCHWAVYLVIARGSSRQPWRRIRKTAAPWGWWCWQFKLETHGVVVVIHRMMEGMAGPEGGVQDENLYTCRKFKLNPISFQSELKDTGDTTWCRPCIVSSPAHLLMCLYASRGTNQRTRWVPCLSNHPCHFPSACLPLHCPVTGDLARQTENALIFGAYGNRCRVGEGGTISYFMIIRRIMCCFWLRLVFPGKRQLETFFSQRRHIFLSFTTQMQKKKSDDACMQMSSSSGSV